MLDSGLTREFLLPGPGCLLVDADLGAIVIFLTLLIQRRLRIWSNSLGQSSLLRSHLPVSDSILPAMYGWGIYWRIALF